MDASFLKPCPLGLLGAGLEEGAAAEVTEVKALTMAGYPQEAPSFPTILVAFHPDWLNRRWAESQVKAMPNRQKADTDPVLWCMRLWCHLQTPV